MPAIDVTTIAMPPQDFWGITFALGFILLTALAYIALTSVGKDYRPPKWEGFSSLTIAILMCLAVIWLALFGLTIWAAIWGTYQMLHAPITQSAPSGGASSGLGGLGLGALLAALLGGPFLIWGTVIKQDTLAVSRQTLSLSETALFNDKVNAALQGLYSRRQITRVIGQGDAASVLTEWEDDIVQRNGAIDRLEGLANERPSEVPRIANMLSVYVRELSNESKPQSHPRQEAAERVEPISGETGIPEEATMHLIGLGDDVSVESLQDWARGLQPFRTDVEKAAQTLGRLCDIVGVEQDAITIDLRGANLQGFDLNGLCFAKAKLNGARMEGAYLVVARMEGAYLSGARLEGANLSRAQMDAADISLARMDGAVLREATMYGANLNEAWLDGANMSEARIERAQLRRARMVEANLYGARMEGANLRRAQMKLADLSEARMSGADLGGARMKGANLTMAWLDGANLSSADMEGVDLSMADMDAATVLTQTNLSKACVNVSDFSDVSISMDQIKSMFGDASVTLLNGITPTHPDWPSHWPKVDLEYDAFEIEYESWLASPSTYTPPDPPQP